MTFQKGILCRYMKHCLHIVCLLLCFHFLIFSSAAAQDGTPQEEVVQTEPVPVQSVISGNDSITQEDNIEEVNVEDIKVEQVGLEEVDNVDNVYKDDVDEVVAEQSVLEQSPDNESLDNQGADDQGADVSAQVIGEVVFETESIKLDDLEVSEEELFEESSEDTLDEAEATALLEQSLSELKLTDLRPVDFYGNSAELRSPNPPNYLLLNAPELNLNDVSTGELGPGDGQNFRDASYLDIWQFVAEAGEAMEIRVRSEFDSFLTIYSPDGQLYAVNDDGLLDQEASQQIAQENGSQDAALRMRIQQSGRYMVVLSGRRQESVGLYSIFSKKLKVQEGGNLTLSQNTYASFGADDQKDSDLALRFDEFNFDLDKTETLSFNLFVEDYEGRLLLFDSEDKLIADSSISGNPMIEQLKPDSYSLRAAIVDDGSVDKKDAQDNLKLYELKVETLMLSFQTSVDMGEDFLSLLATKDRRVNRRYLDAYRYVVSEPTEAIIDLRSKAFDAYLYLYDNSGHIVAENDDASDETGTDAQLVLELPAGVYEIVVTSYIDADKKTGLYNLAISSPNTESNSEQKVDSDTASVGPNAPVNSVNSLSDEN